MLYHIMDPAYRDRQRQKKNTRGQSKCNDSANVPSSRQLEGMWKILPWESFVCKYLHHSGHPRVWTWYLKTYQKLWSAEYLPSPSSRKKSSQLPQPWAYSEEGVAWIHKSCCSGEIRDIRTLTSSTSAQNSPQDWRSCRWRYLPGPFGKSSRCPNLCRYSTKQEYIIRHRSLACR